MRPLGSGMQSRFVLAMGGAMLVVVAIVAAVILLGTVEWMGWWPEWATLDARSHRMLRP